VIHWTWASPIGAFLSAIAIPATAMAGDLAPTSRADAIISITIPAHIWTAEALPNAGQGGSLNDDFFCISNSHQFGSLRIALISRTSGTTGAVVPLELSPEFARESGLKCGPSESALVIPGTHQGNLRPLSGTASEPATLLIIPN
jgi:hypothetical protein